MFISNLSISPTSPVTALKTEFHNPFSKPLGSDGLSNHNFSSFQKSYTAHKSITCHNFKKARTKAIFPNQASWYFCNKYVYLRNVYMIGKCFNIPTVPVRFLPQKEFRWSSHQLNYKDIPYHFPCSFWHSLMTNVKSWTRAWNPWPLLISLWSWGFSG